MACPRDYNNEYYARELANDDGTVPDGDERLERFYAFGDRLRDLYERMKANQNENP